MPTSFDGFVAKLKPLLVSPPPRIADEDFNRLALELFSIQFEALHHYRKFCISLGATPDSIQDWTTVPAVPTASFAEWEWTTIPCSDRSVVFHSSGTTGTKPSRHFHSSSSLALYERSLLAWAPSWLLQNFQPPIPLLSLSPPPYEAPHSSLVHMFDTMRIMWGNDDSQFTGHCSAPGTWTLSVDRTCHALQQLAASNQPALILGTAFSLVELLDHLAATRTCFALPPGSRLLETGGYKGRSRTMPKPELYRLLTRTLGIPITHLISEYGMCELSSQAYDHAAGSSDPHRSFRFPPWVRTLILNPHNNQPAQPGETGLLRVCDLANVWSVMAIQTEDLAHQNQNGFVLTGRTPTAEARGCSLLSLSKPL